MPVPLGERRLPREVMAEHQRRRAVDAAVAVFAERGYPATTIDDLVAAAQMGVGSFYSFFKGKEECLLAIYENTLAEARAAVAAATPTSGDWPQQICSGLRVILGLIAAQPAQARIALVEIQTAGPRALALHEKTLAEAAEALSRGRDLAPPSARLPASLEQTTVRGIAWLLHRRIILGETDDVGMLFEELSQLILEPYIGEEQARAVLAAPPLAQA
jgi:AcrR family transcriptional regulator